MTQLLFAYIIKYWIFAEGVTVGFDSKTIVPGAWQEVSRTQQHCLLYKAALKNQTTSLLSIFQRKNNSPCLENITSTEVYSLPIKKLEALQIKDGKLALEVMESEKIESLSFPLWGEDFDNERPAYIGDVRTTNPNFLENGQYCEDDCSLCPKGFIRVVTADGLKKICKDEGLCGALNEPACFLGLDRIKAKNPCFDGSKAAWCEQGLKTICSAELEYLVCE